MNRKLQLMRAKHAQTREYMEMNALRGIVKDGAGTTLYNYFTEFDLAQISVGFVLGTAGPMCKERSIMGLPTSVDPALLLVWWDHAARIQIALPGPAFVSDAR